MDIKAEKNFLVETVAALINMPFIQQRSDISAALVDLAADIQKDFFLMVVLGEFKRGKSTFVNALIGEKLLPANVLPTTATICALMYDKKRSVNVIKYDGKVEQGQATLEYLSCFSADTGQAEDIKFIEIGLDADILRNRLIIVDTPGVSDINEQRVKVTYDFIPKANAVIFLLDAGAPLKKSEKNFISQHLVPLGLNKIIFVVNKFDDVDEEEQEDLLQDLKKRLTMAFKMNTPEPELKELLVLPVSSLWALNAVEQQNQHLLEQSGIIAVKNKIQEIIFSGEVASNKLFNAQMRLVNILDSFGRQIQNEINLKQTHIEQLQEILDNLDEMQNRSEESRRQIADYAAEETKTILAMTDKSLICFHNKLKDSVNEQINFYKGGDFKEFVEQRLLGQIGKELDHWLYTYSQYIEQLMIKLEHELAGGIARYFQQNINMSTSVRCEQIAKQKFIFNMTAEDVSNTTLQAGLLTAGGAGLAMLVGSTMLLPFLSMAAFPYLQKNMLEKRLQEVKSQVTPIINDQLVQCFYQVRMEIQENIQLQISNIREKYENVYTELLMRSRQQFAEQINEASDEEKSTKQAVQALQKQWEQIDELKNTIKGAN